MRQFFAICYRNLKIYLKDKTSIVFSFLSMLIIIGLMVFFLGDSTVNSIMDVVKMVPGRGNADDLQNVKSLVFLWTSAGILAINAATITLAFYSNMIKDRNANILNSILVMPINRTGIVAGYIVSAWIASVLMNVVTLFIIELVGLTKGLSFFSLMVNLKLIVLIMVNSLVYASVMYFFASIIKTTSAWSGFGTIVGTLVGFLGGIYFPVGELSDLIAKIVKVFPFIYGTSMFRNIMLSDVSDSLFSGDLAVVRESFDLRMGNVIEVFEKSLSIWQEMVILVAVALLFALLSLLYVRFAKKSDR